MPHSIRSHTYELSRSFSSTHLVSPKMPARLSRSLTELWVLVWRTERYGYGITRSGRLRSQKGMADQRPTGGLTSILRKLGRDLCSPQSSYRKDRLEALSFTRTSGLFHRTKSGQTCGKPRRDD